MKSCCKVDEMSHTGCRYHAKSAQGVEYNFLELSQLQVLVDNGSLGPCDEVRVAGDLEDRWFTLDRVEDLRLPDLASGMPATTEYWSDATPVRRRLSVQTFAMATTFAALSLFLAVIGLVLLFLPGGGVVSDGSGTSSEPGLISTLASATSQPAVAEAKQTPAEIFERFSVATPLVTTWCPAGTCLHEGHQDGGLHGHGSGILVEHEGRLLIFTNHHVIHDSEQPLLCRATFLALASDGEPEPVLNLPPVPNTDYRIHLDHSDVAMLDATEHRSSFRKLGIVPARIQHEPPAIGEELVVIGHPGSLGSHEVEWLNLTKGVVSRFYMDRDLESPGWKVGTDVSVNPGNSGGPVFNSKGRIIGVISHGSLAIDPITGEETISGGEQNFAIASRELLETIRDGVPYAPGY